MLFQWSAHGTWTVLIKQNFKLNLKKLDPPLSFSKCAYIFFRNLYLHQDMGLSLLERQRN